MASTVFEPQVIHDPMEATLRLYRGLRLLWHYLDEAQREVERFNGGRPICMEKCGLCCQRTTPLVSKLEVSYMVGRLHPHEPIREATLAWVKDANPTLRAQGIAYGQVLSGEALTAIQEDNLVLQAGTCPFLTHEMGCQVHAARPLICRAYGVTLVPDEWCPRPLTGCETPNGRMLVGKDTPLGMKIMATTIAVWQAMKHMEREDLATLGFLPMLVAEALALSKVKELRDQGLIQPAKMGKGRWVLPNLFGGQR